MSKITWVLLVLKLITLNVFILFSNISHGFHSIGENALTYNHIAKAIKTKYDQEIPRLNAYKASHYAARIYRISGDTAYLDYNLLDLKNMRTNAEKLLQIAQNGQEVEFSKSLTDAWPSGIRTNLRRDSLSIAPTFPYFLKGLNLLRRALEYSICSSQFDQLKAHILNHDYTFDLSDPLMVKAWAAQLANTVVWIKQLGGNDYSEIFVKAIHQVYPDNQDYLLSAQQYNNKIYALTHIILAESQYYQYKINRSDNAWIFNYFDNNINFIVSRAKADVVAEVGISYLLAGEYDNPAFKKTKQNIALQYDEAHRMIPSVKGNFNISTGTHRNILAIMLLSSPQQFYPGPWLGLISDAKLFPYGIKSCNSVNQFRLSHPTTHKIIGGFNSEVKFN